MNFTQLASQRFSVRKYSDRAVPHDMILSIVEAGRLAPSAVNYQPWHFIIVESAKSREALQVSYPREWFAKAPVYLVVCADISEAWTRAHDHKNFAEIDACIAADHMILQATELGLGTCWVCNFDPEICQSALQLPEHIKPVVLIPIGFPDEPMRIKNRKPLNEILHWDGYKKTKI